MERYKAYRCEMGAVGFILQSVLPLLCSEGVLKTSCLIEGMLLVHVQVPAKLQQCPSLE